MPRGKIGRARPDSKAIDVEIARLRELDVGTLRGRWHTMFGRRAPPHLARVPHSGLPSPGRSTWVISTPESQRLLDHSTPEKAGQQAASQTPTSDRHCAGTRVEWADAAGGGLFARRREISAFRGLPGGPGGVPLFQLIKNLGCPTSLSDASATKGQFSEFPNHWRQYPPPLGRSTAASLSGRGPSLAQSGPPSRPANFPGVRARSSVIRLLAAGVQPNSLARFLAGRCRTKIEAGERHQRPFY
jgi:hypothetical protein